jgi:hypothetical protein
MAGRLVVNTLNTDTVGAVLTTQNGMTGIAKAWVNFVGSSGSINSSFNVSSVTRNGAGVYTINFTTAMPNANYCSALQSWNQGSVLDFNSIYGDATAQQAGSLKVGCYNGGFIDPTNFQAVIFSA